MRTVAAIVIALAVTGCRTDPSAWRTRLSSLPVRQIRGDWSVDLRLDDIADSSHRRLATGEIAITLNDAGLDARGFTGRPLFFGSYDINFDSLGFAGGAVSDVPAVAGTLIGDSLVLVLAPSSDEPVELRGVAAGDSITGRWHAHRRAGSGATGDFLMRHHPHDS